MTRDGGKGDTPRPIKDRDSYSENWDRIFEEKDGSLTINVNPNEKIEIRIDFENIEGRN
jgi:hypothetical protein